MIKMLHYQNDSWLLDRETANDLITAGRNNFLFLDQEKKILNLFSAFVKRSDFVGTGKIQPLQRTVYVKVSQNVANILQSRYTFKEILKLLESYTGKRTNCQVSHWFETRIFPLVLLRIGGKNQDEFSRWVSEIIYITDYLNKAKFYSPKTKLELSSKKLIYLVGCSVGDGHIDKKGKRWTLVDGSSDQNRLKLSGEFVSNLTTILNDYVRASHINKMDTKYELDVNNKPFCRFLNFFFGLPYGSKKNCTLQVPLVLKFNDYKLEKYFWRGLFDTDGSALGLIDFCSSDKNLSKQCHDYLEQIGVSSKETIRGGVSIGISEFKKFCAIGFAHPRKQIEFLSSLQIGPSFKSVRIKENQKVNYQLSKIQELLRVDETGYRIRINSVALKKKGLEISEVQQIVKNLFGYEFRKAANDMYYFKSKKVYEYLRSIFIYEPAWEAITEEDEYQLLCSWNDVWRK